MEKREKSEIKAQSDCLTKLWNQRPELRGRIFAVNNNSENEIKGAINRAMGVLSGVSDTIFIGSNGRTIYIEWKTENGSQSKAQKEWQRLIESFGHIYYIVRSECEFLRVISIYE